MGVGPCAQSSRRFICPCRYSHIVNWADEAETYMRTDRTIKARFLSGKGKVLLVQQLLVWLASTLVRRCDILFCGRQ